MYWVTWRRLIKWKLINFSSVTRNTPVKDQTTQISHDQVHQPKTEQRTTIDPSEGSDPNQAIPITAIKRISKQHNNNDSLHHSWRHPRESVQKTGHCIAWHCNALTLKVPSNYTKDSRGERMPKTAANAAGS